MIEKTYPITEKLLNKGLALSQKLHELISQEAVNLKNKPSPDTISDLADSKKETVSQLEQFSKQLTQILATENLPLSQEGINKYFQKAHKAGLPASNALKYWKKITTISKKCRSLNEENGACIGLLIRHSQRSLEILRGKPQTASTYGPDGSTKSEGFSHTLISV